MYLKKKKKELQESAWLIGICENGYDDLMKNNIHWIDNGVYDGKKWFADPFILDYDEKMLHLLVEEFDYKVHRGRIAKLTIDRNTWTIKECKIVLDLPTHLSFPLIWREGADVFVCPENYASGGWNLYRYDSEVEKLELIKQIVDIKLTDAIIYHEGNDYWLLSTYVPKPNGHELTIWHGESLIGEFQEIQRVSFDENVGRNAGMMFHKNGKLIRPAQESNYSYGHSISFQEVTIEGEKFSFKESYRFYSPHKKYNEGTHTYNTLGNMSVIDVKGWRYPIAAKVIRFFGYFLIVLHLKRRYRPK